MKQFALLICILFSVKGYSQLTQAETFENLKVVVEGKDFRFLPQAAMTDRGNNTKLDPGYILKIIKDSMYLDVPFFETGYTVAFGSDDDIVKFSSTKFSYKSEMKKKGGWSININPSDDPKIKHIHLEINPEGYCTMLLSLSGKPPITYSGTIGDNLSQ